jgi:apolipoprotein N-acyltransferase
MLVGVATAYGEPGVGLAPLFLLGLIGISFLCARARSVTSASTMGVAYGVGMFAPIMISSVSWGLIVPVALTSFGVALYALPLTLWSYFGARRWSGAALFIGTVAAWALCMDLGDLVGFPSKCEALSAVAFAPVLMGGSRLVGTNMLCGVIMAGAVTCGSALARLAHFDALSALRALRPLGASLALLLATSGLARALAAPPSASLSVGVPQLAVPSSYFKLRQALPQQTERIEEQFSEQVAALGNVDLLALTETYDGTFPLQVPRLRQRFENNARLQKQAILLTSYLVGKNGGGLNAVGGISADGKLVGVHRKVNLAPFGEGELERGAGFHPLPVLPQAKVGALICQEALLAEGPRALARAGANLLVTTTSDISFGSGILGFGHLAAARLRAIEAGRAMIWASNGGPSGAIGRWGEFESAAPFLEPYAASMRVDLFDDRAPFLRISGLLPALCVAALLWLILRARGASSPAPRVEPKQIGTLRGALSLVLALALATVASVGSVAVVELRNGEASRVRAATLELVGHSAPNSEQASLARFHTDAAHTASGALAYYLDYYGDRRLPANVALPEAQPKLADLARELAETEQFPTREVQLDFRNPPRAGTLVRAKSGELGVLMSNSLGEIGVFVSTQSGLITLNHEQARSLLEPIGLLPAIDPSLD